MHSPTALDTSRVQGDDSPSPTWPVADMSWSLGKASVVAGVGILLLALFAGFGYPFAVAGLVTEDDPARTAADILGSKNLFRLGILSLFLAAVLDVVIAWSLYRVFSPVSDSISRLASWLRLAYAAVFLVAISHLVGVLRLLSDADYLTVFSSDQLQTQALLRINTYTDVWHAGLILFGLHLLVIGYLAYRSGFMPKLLGILLAIAGAGYVFDSIAGVLVDGSVPDVTAFTFIGEFLLALWLVVWGRRVTVATSERHDYRIGTAS